MQICILVPDATRMPFLRSRFWWHVNLIKFYYKCIGNFALEFCQCCQLKTNTLAFLPSTVWKFHYFVSFRFYVKSSFMDSQSTKSAILPHFGALNLDFYEFLHFLKAVIDQINKIQGPKNGKTAVLELLESQKFDFT